VDTGAHALDGSDIKRGQGKRGQGRGHALKDQTARCLRSVAVLAGRFDLKGIVERKDHGPVDFIERSRPELQIKQVTDRGDLPAAAPSALLSPSFTKESRE